MAEEGVNAVRGEVLGGEALVDEVQVLDVWGVWACWCVCVGVWGGD